jgi:hypothetical protein
MPNCSEYIKKWKDVDLSGMKEQVLGAYRRDYLTVYEKINEEKKADLEKAVQDLTALVLAHAVAPYDIKPEIEKEIKIVKVSIESIEGMVDVHAWRAAMKTISSIVSAIGSGILKAAL